MGLAQPILHRYYPASSIKCFKNCSLFHLHRSCHLLVGGKYLLKSHFLKCGISKGAMPPPDTMFCAQQINIPTELPDILKQFTKAAIRTQPHDVLQWSAAYFSALSSGETLPVKERLEMPIATQKTDTGLTPGLLKILHKQLSPKGTVEKAELEQRWKELCLPKEQLNSIIELGNFGTNIVWIEFFALGCSALNGTITTSLKCACEILTADPEGGAARIPFETFTFLFTYLNKFDGEMPQDQIDSYLSTLREEAKQQFGMVQPLNFTGLNRPKLPD